jgi:cell division inhibitor SulA
MQMNTAYHDHFSNSDTIQRVATPIPSRLPARQPQKIAEIIVPNFSESSLIVLPIIASLSQQPSNQWMTWITHRKPSKAMLQSLGANLHHLRIVHTKKHEDCRWIAWQALAQGNSHTVIAEQGYWSKEDLYSMETAAEESNTRGILISLVD